MALRPMLTDRPLSAKSRLSIALTLKPWTLNLLSNPTHCKALVEREENPQALSWLPALRVLWQQTRAPGYQWRVWQPNE